MAENQRRILGVDPGTNVLGFAVIEAADTKQLRLLTLDVLRLESRASAYVKLKHIYDCIQRIITTYHPAEMAIEAPFFGKNVQSMLKLGRAQGVAIAAAIAGGLEVTEYQPRKIKQSVTGNGNASKEQVAALLSTQLNFTLGEQYFDATDALAAAVCHFYQNKLQGGAKKRYGGWEDFLRDNPKKAKP